MNVLVVEPNTIPYEKEVKGLHEMQAVVGGLIQAIYPYEEQVAIVCNDEGLLLDLPFNRVMDCGYGAVFGNFFVCALTEDSFGSLSPEQMERFKKRFQHAEILLGFRGDTPLVLRVDAQPKEKPTAKERPKPHERG